MKTRLLLTLGAMALIGCDHHAVETPTTVDAPEARVSIDNFSFSPTNLMVHPGTRVTWTNCDDVPHTVTESVKAFSSSALDTDQTFSRLFDKPGTYSYYCAVHPHMTGKVIVK